MKTWLCSIAAGLIATSAFADNITVYRWVDKNNVVHFSQNQPSNDNYTELSLRNVPKPEPEHTQPLEANAKDKGSKTTAMVDFKKKCDTATANLRTLKAFDKIQYTDSNGETKVLSDEEKAQQLTLNEKQAELYCAEQ